MIAKKAYAKVNIFLKISGLRGNYHEIVSRFVRVDSLYDIITFEKGQFEKFTLDGSFGCSLEKNTIYKAYLLLKEFSSDVEELFRNYKVSVEKNIPEFAGLGGGSSDAATFMILTNSLANLKLSKDQLASLGAKIGADVPFFIYEYESANVTGIGEVVEKFDEKSLNISTFTPDIKCNTGEIFTIFREKFYKVIEEKRAKELLQMTSNDILDILTIEDANDLYLPAVTLYKNLKQENLNLDKSYFFSGSGSSFFKVEK